MIQVYGANTTRADLKEVVMERPDTAGRYWMGVPHHDLIETIEESARTRGWEVTDEKYALSNDRADLAGALSLHIPETDAPEGQTFSLGFLTSNAMRRALKMVAGTEIRVCNNGMATGEIVLNRRHTSGLSLFDEVDDAMDIYGDKIREVPGIVAGWKDRELSRNDVDNILMKTGEELILPWSRVGKVLNEYKNPTFAEHNEPTSWGLLNAFTYIAQKQPPLSQLDCLCHFKNLLPAAAVN